LTNDTRYNGWANYQTWCVNLWIDNSRGDAEHWTEQAQECVQESIADEDADIRSCATYALSKRLEESFDDQKIDMAGVTGMFADLLDHALNMIDWYEIAQHYISEIDIFSAGWNIPGYMPDNNPSIFTDANDALRYVLDEIENDEEQTDILLEDISNLKASSSGEFGQTIGRHHYFVTKI